VEDKLYRAISGSGGTGGIKSVTNYAPVSIHYLDENNTNPTKSMLILRLLSQNNGSY